MTYFATKYTSRKQLMELDKIPGLLWANLDRPSGYTPWMPLLEFDTRESKLYQSRYCDVVLSFEDFKKEVKKALGLMWEQEDLD